MPDDDAELSSSSGSGSGSPDAGVDAQRVLARLGEAECLELLTDGGMGRLVFTSRYGPTALPVMYKIDEGSIVVGTWDPIFDEDLRTGIADADYQVAVEADQIDPQAREGWIVLARGAAHHLDTEAERASIIDAGLEPWFEEIPAHYIRVTPANIFGVRVRRV
jgi:nitroimidazol reductase NimA-like FMN-containing flavoprotein (pyridoxamine 5'-phosphate oxidase superfamily)